MPRRRWMHALLWEDLTSLTSGSSIAWVARSGSSALFGGDRLLFRAPTLPVGVSIEGRRVAWAENVGAATAYGPFLGPK
jgi:hypothetical protein